MTSRSDSHLQALRFAGAGSSRGRLAGFSLLELMIALAILALAISVVSASVARRSPGAELRQVSAELSGLLREARLTASETGAPVTIVFDARNRRFSLENSDLLALPEGTDAEVVSSSSLGQPGIKFWPHGGSTGGAITLRTGTLQERIEVDWLTSRIDRRRLR